MPPIAGQRRLLPDPDMGSRCPNRWDGARRLQVVRGGRGAPRRRRQRAAAVVARPSAGQAYPPPVADATTGDRTAGPQPDSEPDATHGAEVAASAVAGGRPLLLDELGDQLA